MIKSTLKVMLARRERFWKEYRTKSKVFTKGDLAFLTVFDLYVQAEWPVLACFGVNLEKEKAALSADKWLYKAVFNVERAKGIEPSYSAWEADVLPLNYARKNIFIYYSGWKKKSQWQIKRILSVLYGKCPCENLWILRYWRYGKSVV